MLVIVAAAAIGLFASTVNKRCPDKQYHALYNSTIHCVDVGKAFTLDIRKNVTANATVTWKLLCESDDSDVGNNTILHFDKVTIKDIAVYIWLDSSGKSGVVELNSLVEYVTSVGGQVITNYTILYSPTRCPSTPQTTIHAGAYDGKVGLFASLDIQRPETDKCTWTKLSNTINGTIRKTVAECYNNVARVLDNHELHCGTCALIIHKLKLKNVGYYQWNITNINGHVHTGFGGVELCMCHNSDRRMPKNVTLPRTGCLKPLNESQLNYPDFTIAKNLSGELFNQSGHFYDHSTKCTYILLFNPRHTHPPHPLI